MSKRCLACDRRAYLGDVHCQQCGAAIMPPPPAWLIAFGRVFWVLVVMAVPVQLYQFGHAVMRTEQGRAAFGTLGRLARFIMANFTDIAGIVFGFIVAPLIGLYFALRAMVDIGDWIELKTQQWRAERFRKYGGEQRGELGHRLEGPAPTTEAKLRVSQLGLT